MLLFRTRDTIKKYLCEIKKEGNTMIRSNYVWVVLAVCISLLMITLFSCGSDKKSSSDEVTEKERTTKVASAIYSQEEVQYVIDKLNGTFGYEEHWSYNESNGYFEYRDDGQILDIINECKLDKEYYEEDDESLEELGYIKSSMITCANMIARAVDPSEDVTVAVIGEEDTKEKYCLVVQRAGIIYDSIDGYRDPYEDAVRDVVEEEMMKTAADDYYDQGRF